MNKEAEGQGLRNRATVREETAESQERLSPGSKAAGRGGKGGAAVPTFCRGRCVSSAQDSLY